MRKIQHLLGSAGCAALAFSLAACSSKLPVSPDTYDLGSESVPSFTEVLGQEDSGTMTDMETPETTQADSSASSSSAEEWLYTYDQLPSGGDVVARYVESLTAQSVGFQVVDQDGVETDAPDYTVQTGDVILAKAAAESGKLLQIHISWTETSCQIVLTLPDGEITAPPAQPMTNDDAVDYLKGLSPSSLGLSGSSMQDYHIYPIQGMVLVDHIPCLKLQAYQLNQETNANEIVGIYLLSSDKRHLYQLADGHVRELDAL